MGRSAAVLTMLDLFSGIGGFSLAAEWTGSIRTVAFCEIEPFCQKVLRKHWPDVPISSDIKELRGEDIGTVDILTGGFPCQPFSCAGKQRGKEDDRYLWPEMFRVIQETKPTWVIGENVAGLINLALEDCFLDLEAEGYEVQPLIIPACAVNAPHRRDRVWIVGYSESARKRVRQQKRVDRQIFSEAGRKQGVNLFNASSQNATDTYGNAGNQWRTEPAGQQRAARTANGGYDVADSHSEGLSPQRLEGGLRETQGETRSSPQRRSMLDEVWRTKGRSAQSRLGRMVNGLPAGVHGYFDREPDIPRIATGIKNRVDRIKALGNSIVPQVAYPILQAIAEIEQGVTGQ